jgi:hypothetical protein
MSICNQCGEEIVFRWVGGAVTPIHVNGGWCTAGSGSATVHAQSRFNSTTSYLDPNARCPVCGASVYFYRSPHNGRVHPCTDTYQGRDDQIMRPVTSRYRFHFKSKEGRPLNVYIVDQIIERADAVSIILKNTERRSERRPQNLVIVVVSKAEMDKQSVNISDIRDAPSLVLPRDRAEDGKTTASFMCARLQAVVLLVAKEIPR